MSEAPAPGAGAANPALYPLAALLCGFEKSGTTLLNEILRRHPRLDSGFEGGFLLGDSPREFRNIQPYCTFFRQTWELSREDVAYICDTDNWGECYRRARERSPVILDKHSLLFDKTPIYMKHLAAVLGRAPGIPCIVSIRDPRALMMSWAHWSGAKQDPQRWLEDNFDANVARYLDYAAGFCEARRESADRLLLVRFEELCTQPETTLRAVFDFLGLSFDPGYLSFSSRHFVYGNSISTDYLFPYRRHLSVALCERILEATGKHADWHYLA